MKKIVYCLALSALSAFSGPRNVSGSPLRIYTDFQYGTSGAIDSSMQRELADLVEPIGLNLDWKSLALPHEGEVSQALVVITFKGRCSVERLEPHQIVPGALAWTHINDGVILPFVDVDCDRLREFLQASLIKRDYHTRDQLFGRALARVVGHELYHVFAETRHHDTHGVGQPAFTTAELLKDNFSFAEKEFCTLRSSKLSILLPFHKKSPGDNGRTEYAAAGCGSCHGDNGQGSKWAPAIRGKSKTLDPKVLTARFEKKRETMYSRARDLKLRWQFPDEEEVREIVALLTSGVE